MHDFKGIYECSEFLLWAGDFFFLLMQTFPNGKGKKDLRNIYSFLKSLLNTGEEKSQQCEAGAEMQVLVTFDRSNYSVYSSNDTNLLSFNFLLNFLL